MSLFAHLISFLLLARAETLLHQAQLGMDCLALYGHDGHDILASCFLRRLFASLLFHRFLACDEFLDTRILRSY